MLRTNLSTRPFYNERALRAALWTAGVLVAAILVYDLVHGVRISARLRTLNTQAALDEQRASEFRQRAARLRAGIDVAELERVQAAAREANSIIDRRTFSWTQLLNVFETALPPGVMLTAVWPQIGTETVSVTLSVIGQSVEDIDDFMEGLDGTGVFSDVLSTDEQAQEDGRLRATVIGTYRPGTLSGAGSPAGPGPARATMARR